MTFWMPPCSVYRQCGLAYAVAFANGGAKDVTRRYIGHMPYTQKLRDSKWFRHLLAPLHKAEVRQTPADCDTQVQAATGTPETAVLHLKMSSHPVQLHCWAEHPQSRLPMDSLAVAACSRKLAGV